MDELVETAAVRGTARTLWRWSKHGTFHVTFKTPAGLCAHHELTVCPAGDAVWIWRDETTRFNVACFRYQVESVDLQQAMQSGFRSSPPSQRTPYNGEFEVVVTDATSAVRVFAITYKLWWSLVFGFAVGWSERRYEGLDDLCEGRWIYGGIVLSP